MASQDDAEETQTPTRPTLKTVLMDSPVQEKRKCERDGEVPDAKRPKPEPLRISELREDVQMFIRADAKERNLPGPMYQQKLSESFGRLAPKDAAGSTMENPTDMTPSHTPPMPIAPEDKSQDEDPLRAITAESKVVTDADAGEEMTDAGKENGGQAAAAATQQRDDKDQTQYKLPANRDNACKDTASEVSCTHCPGAGSVPSGDESCDTEATGEDETLAHASIQPPDGVPEAESQLSDKTTYAVLLEMHNKFEMMGRNVGERGGSSISRIRSAIAELPARLQDIGDMPNIKKDLAERHRLGKHQMREMIRRIEFFFVLAENQYKDKLAKNI